MTNTDYLKPCAFCGHPVTLHQDLLKGTWVIVCGNCGADVMFFGAEHDRMKFIRKWNSRKGDKK